MADQAGVTKRIAAEQGCLGLVPVAHPKDIQTEGAKPMLQGFVIGGCMVRSALCGLAMTSIRSRTKDRVGIGRGYYSY